MGLQLILVMETNRQCKSDWIYIKETIDHFYKYDISHVRFSPIFMDGKGNYENKEKSVKKLISQYSSTSRQNRTEVIYCFDTDKYDTNQEDRSFFETVRAFCTKRGYHFVWFCQDIEQVYLGKSVENSKKCIESAAFKRKKLIIESDPAKLSSGNIRKKYKQHYAGPGPVSDEKITAPEWQTIRLFPRKTGHPCSDKTIIFLTPKIHIVYRSVYLSERSEKCKEACPKIRADLLNASYQYCLSPVFCSQPAEKEP